MLDYLAFCFRIRLVDFREGSMSMLLVVYRCPTILSMARHAAYVQPNLQHPNDRPHTRRYHKPGLPRHYMLVVVYATSPHIAHCLMPSEDATAHPTAPPRCVHSHPMCKNGRHKKGLTGIAALTALNGRLSHSFSLSIGQSIYCCYTLH